MDGTLCYVFQTHTEVDQLLPQDVSACSPRPTEKQQQIESVFLSCNYLQMLMNLAALLRNEGMFQYNRV